MNQSRHLPPVHAQPRLSRADGTAIRAVVLDGDDSLTDLLSLALRYEGWDIRLASDVQQAFTTIREFRPDVIVLDIMMPGLASMTILKRMRTEGIQTPILFLTAKEAIKSHIVGLTIGGDDYLAKPFSFEELVARLRALLRRSTLTIAGDTDPVIQVGDLFLDESTHEVSRAGKNIELTTTEFKLLRYLMRNPRRVLRHAQILDRVWNYDFGGRASVVEIYISYLRKKIDVLGPPMIQTVRGVGYMLRAAE